MSQAELKFYYKNVTAEIIGAEHGMSKNDFDALQKQCQPVIKQVNELRKNGQTPYRDLPYNKAICSEIRQMADSVKDGCENLVVLGIGGSALGNIALQTALNPYMYNIDENQRKGPRLFVFDNVDPAQLNSFIQWVSDKLDKTIFNVISKSGRTSETASQFMVIFDLLNKKLGPENLAKQVVATTDPKAGTLRKIANELKLKCLEVPDGVGGRFSVLSAVGLFSAAMCGIDIEGLLAGAQSMDKIVTNENFYKNPAALNAAINYYYYGKGKKNSVMMPYCYALKDMADWYRQLWAESLGKANDLNGNVVNIGPTRIKALGTTDQHSQVQLYREGPNDKIFTLLSVTDFGKKQKIGPAPKVAPELDFLAGADMTKLMNSEKAATEYALLKDERPCLNIIFEKVDAFSVGQFIYFYEVTTSIAGALFNINTYDQPAVELGKEATFALMGHEDFAEMADKIAPYTQIDSDYLI